MAGRRRESQHGEIGVGILADHPRGQPAAVGEDGLDQARARDDVAVGDEKAVGREDEPRSRAGGLAVVVAIRVPFPGESRRLGVGKNLEVDDSGAHCLDRRDDGPRIGVEELAVALIGRGPDFGNGADCARARIVHATKIRTAGRAEARPNGR